MEINELTRQIETLLDTRDLRLYGINGWTLDETLQMAAQAQQKPVEMIATTAKYFRLALPNMDTPALREMLHNLKKCPPKPKEV